VLEWAATKLPRLHLDPEPQQVVQTLRTAAHWTQVLPLGVVTLVLAPAGEEVLFRGILYPWVKQGWSPRVALWSTSLIFGAIHLNLVTLVPLTVLAVALVMLYERTGNLLAPITAHALFNAVNLAQLYGQGVIG
jgi:membrane protease YdiL (CAAX protease family)